MKRFLNIKETADLLSIGNTAMRKLAVNGNVPCFKIGNRWKFNPDALLKWLKDKEEAQKQNIKKITTRKSRRLSAMNTLSELLISEMKEREIDFRELGMRADIPANVITGLITGRTVMNDEIAEKLGKVFNTSGELWLNLGNKIIKAGTVWPWCHRKTARDIIL